MNRRVFIGTIAVLGLIAFISLFTDPISPCPGTARLP